MSATDDIARLAGPLASSYAATLPTGMVAAAILAPPDDRGDLRWLWRAGRLGEAPALLSAALPVGTRLRPRGGAGRGMERVLTVEHGRRAASGVGADTLDEWDCIEDVSAVRTEAGESVPRALWTFEPSRGSRPAAIRWSEPPTRGARYQVVATVGCAFVVRAAELPEVLPRTRAPLPILQRLTLEPT